MEEPRTIISEDVEINGSIKCTGGVKLGGKVIGDLTCGGDVLVEKSASVKGNVTANSVVVLVQIKGNITSKERIELKGVARVAGDIKAKRLVVEDGVSLSGKTEISPSESGAGDVGLELGVESTTATDDARTADEDMARSVATHRGVTDTRARASQLFARK